MRVACIGGGPAGLYLATLLRARDPATEVVVFERNAPDDTFGFGVVFSDATLGRLAAADPASHAAIARQFARWDDIEIHVAGEVLRSTGHGFCGLERRALLAILTARAREVGVEVRHHASVARLGDVGPADLTVIADGVASQHREALADALGPRVDVRPNKFVWLATTLPLRAFTFYFVETKHGLLRVHAYPFTDGAGGTSTFIVECTRDTWQRAGFAAAPDDDAATARILEGLLAHELRGHPLLTNRSIWRNFPTVRNARWHTQTPHGPVVLLGDAAHTAHYSIGSGTKLAMEDAIALADELGGAGGVAAALASYEAKRRPEVEALQAAAEASLRWFEHTERYRRQPPAQFAYGLMTRSLRVSHGSMTRRDPALVAAVEDLLAARADVVTRPPPPPSQLPLALPGLRLVNRLAVVADPAPGDLGDTSPGGVVGDEHLVRVGALARRGAALVLTEVMDPAGDVGAPGLFTDDQVVGWRRVVDDVHARTPAAIAAVLRVARGETRAVVEAAWRAEYAGFDALALAFDDAADADEVGAAIAAVRRAWAERRPLIARLPAAPAAAMVAIADRARQEGAALVWVHAAIPPGVGIAGDAAVALAADAVRHEAQTPIAASLPDAGPDLVDAHVAAGRVDLVVLGRAPTELGWEARA